jgi:alkaline phosphatase
MKKYYFSFLVCLFTVAGFSQNVHSHNDYLQKKPFWDAYLAGAKSIEADVFLVNDTLWVAHESNEISKDKTFEKMYLQPLNKIVSLKNRQELQILIDLKTDYKVTLDKLIDLLKKYPKLLIKNANIRFVVSGNRPPLGLYSEYPEYIYFDHQSLADLVAGNKKIALVSFSFASISKWNGIEKLSDLEAIRLLNTITKVHSLGYKIRFWASPDTELAWKTLSNMSLDYINTDKPKHCFGFLRKK